MCLVAGLVKGWGGGGGLVGDQEGMFVHIAEILWWADDTPGYFLKTRVLLHSVPVFNLCYFVSFTMLSQSKYAELAQHGVALALGYLGSNTDWRHSIATIRG